MNYHDKYLKYKNKYLQLKSELELKLQQFGGDKPFIKNINGINLFTDPEMEKYLNPIYGLLLCSSGFIPNNFYLNLSKIIVDDVSKIIKKIAKEENFASIKPTNDIMTDIKPIDIGRYIGIKYINMINNIIVNVAQKITFIQKINKDEVCKKKLTEYISKLRNYIPIEKFNELDYFHLLLYCLWWVANNDEGIKEYYKGINEVFSIINPYLSPEKPYELINTDIIKLDDTDSFENIVFEITKEPFKVYGQEKSKNFCHTSTSTYPDCGEITARNLLNLICFSHDKFDIDILKKFNSIPQVIEYYTQFNDFIKQSDNKLYSIYEDNLNARDAWSKLIINHGKTNVEFVKSCNEVGNNYRFELNAGLSTDKTIGNFLQLIKNLLPGITKWDDLKTELITDFTDKTVNGVGIINITHEEYGNITIHLETGHYYMEPPQTDNSINYDHLNENQQNQIKILLKKQSDINIDNYLWVKFDSNLLVSILNNIDTNIELKIKLFDLSLTSQYDSDTRRRIELDVDDFDFFNNIICKYRDNVNMNEYTYKCNEFNFVKKMPNLIHLNCKIKNTYLTNIDLSPLSNITSIGDNFMYDCRSLTSIDLSLLLNVQSIGNYFMRGCEGLISIDLSGLSNVQSIGDNFMRSCLSLTSIDLYQLSKVQSIGNDFMRFSSSLTSIDLSGLSNVQSIGNSFMYGCLRLTSIDLSGLSNVQSIGNFFMSGCEGLISIDLSGLSNVQSIGDKFMGYCSGLTSIDLSPLSNVQSIGDSFIYECSGLTSIDLSPLSNITSIGDNFMGYCRSLTSIDLSGLSNVQSIGNFFMRNCSGLTSINLSPFSNVQSIENYFMLNCSGLTSIDLSPLSNITSIGDNFMEYCSGLTSIKCTKQQQKLLENKININVNFEVIQ
jgi:hypothetical protein